MSEEHTSLPVHLPSLEHLTNEELIALRGRIAYVSREARRKATQAIGKYDALKKPWHRTLNLKKDAPTEEREEAMQALELELLRVPEAFLAHAYANSLIILDTACRDEMLRRSMPGTSPNKRKGKEAPPQSVPPEGLDVLSIIDAIDRQET